MFQWQRFLDSLDSSGGHILLLLSFVVVLLFIHTAAAEKYTPEIIGALLRGPFRVDELGSPMRRRSDVQAT